MSTLKKPFATSLAPKTPIVAAVIAVACGYAWWNHNNESSHPKVLKRHNGSVLTHRAPAEGVSQLQNAKDKITPAHTLENISVDAAHP